MNLQPIENAMTCKSFLRCALFIFLTTVLGTVVQAQGFNVDIGDSSVDVSTGAGVVETSFNIAIQNPTSDPLEFSGYTLFLDIGPSGLALPAGVTLANPPATYLSGNGIAPLVGAGTTPPGATLNLAPAAGDLGLGQIQFFDASIAAGQSFDLITVNLLVDLSIATPGDFDLFLSPDGQSSISSTTQPSQAFTSSIGRLSLVDSIVILGDVNQDGVANFFDIAPFIAILSNSEFQDEADINRDGVVDFFDIAPFIAILSGQ